jgi:hypothetical protein
MAVNGRYSMINRLSIISLLLSLIIIPGRSGRGFHRGAAADVG